MKAVDLSSPRLFQARKLQMTANIWEGKPIVLRKKGLGSHEAPAFSHNCGRVRDMSQRWQNWQATLQGKISRVRVEQGQAK